MKTIPTNAPYALIMGADTLLAKAYALDLAKRHHNVLLVGRPQKGLTDWALQLMTYGIEVDVFEVDPFDRENLEMLANWIHNCYFISHFHNLTEMDWMEEVFYATTYTRKIA